METPSNRFEKQKKNLKVGQRYVLQTGIAMQILVQVIEIKFEGEEVSEVVLQKISKVTPHDYCPTAFPVVYKIGDIQESLFKYLPVEA